MKREDFFARVRQAVQQGNAHRPHVNHDLPERVGYEGAGDDPPARLAAEVQAVGGVAHLVETKEEAKAALSSLIAGCEPEMALCWQHPVLDALDLAALLDKRGVQRIDGASLAKQSAGEQRRDMLAADLGITSVSYAVAETGTLAFLSAPGHERLASLAPPIHVAVVSADQILPDLFDLFDKLEERGLGELASNLALVTGPSKTGDLGLQLTTGVHGPGKWHVIVCREAIASS